MSFRSKTEVRGQVLPWNTVSSFVLGAEPKSFIGSRWEQGNKVRRKCCDRTTDGQRETDEDPRLHPPTDGDIIQNRTVGWSRASRCLRVICNSGWFYIRWSKKVGAGAGRGQSILIDVSSSYLEKWFSCHGSERPRRWMQIIKNRIAELTFLEMKGNPESWKNVPVQTD